MTAPLIALIALALFLLLVALCMAAAGRLVVREDTGEYKDHE